MLYHFFFLDHAFSVVAKRSLLVATAAVHEGTTTVYPRGSSRNLEVSSALIVCKDSSRPRKAIFIVQDMLSMGP